MVLHRPVELAPDFGKLTLYRAVVSQNPVLRELRLINTTASVEYLRKRTPRVCAAWFIELQLTIVRT
jgi:hypothetical protein